MFELDNVKNETILWDILNFRSWQHQKRNNSARLPSKMESWLQSWRPRANRADGLVPMRFATFPLHLSKVLRLPRKSDARSYEVLHLSRKIILAIRQIWCSKMQPLSGNQRPDLRTSLMNMSYVLLTFEKVHNPFCLPSETTSERPKVARTCGVLYILTSKCALRHSSVHFFNISTSKSGGTCSVLTFWLGNVLRATTCTFSTSQLPTVVRTPGVFNILTWKCASHHNNVHFFDISTSKSGPNPWCF